MSMKMMALLTGMGIVGYMYLKTHPELSDMMKDLGSDVSKKMSKMMDNNEMC